MYSQARAGRVSRWMRGLVAAGLLALGAGPAQAQNIPQPEEAFQPSAEAAGADRVRITWEIGDETYLYRSKIDVQALAPDGVKVADLRIPEGKVKYDETFGKEMQVFRDSVEVVAILERPSEGALDTELEVSYQGCADAGVCYPPQTSRFDVTLPEPGSAEAKEMAAAGADQAAQESAAPASEQTRFANALETGGLLAVGVFFLAGLGLAFTPCVFPMIPILSGIIVGQGGEGGMTKRRAFLLSVAYVLGVAVTYAILGVIAGATGAYIQAALQNPWVLGAFAAVFVALALSMFGFYDIQMPSSVQSRIQQKQQESGSGGGFLGTAAMGVLSALIVGPCVAPPLAGALLYIGQQGDLVLGGVSLFALSLGMGVPLLAVGTTAGSFLPRAGAWMEKVKYVFGVLMLAVAVFLLSRVIPTAVTLFLWGVLLVVSAVYMGALERLDPEVSGWRRLWKGLGVVLLVLGALELVGSVTGARDPFKPLAGIQASSGGSGGGEQHAGLEFRQVDSLEELRSAVDKAAEQGRPVMLDFYADWCVECVRYERTTFESQEVAQALEGVTLLQVDVTEQDSADKEIQGEFDVIGPPAILFFGPDGEEIGSGRIAGYKDAEAFTEHARRVLEQ